jgi:mono/diheme cytochrome c family protein
MKKSWSKLILGAALSGGVLFVATGVSASSDDLVPNSKAKADYVNYCASCHGVGGTGNGPMASELKTKPTDLTLLAKNNGGNFPFLKLRKVIDGSYTTGSLRAHSSNEMPIWGDAFRREEQLGGNSYTTTQARIMNILDYISMIQY